MNQQRPDYKIYATLLDAFYYYQNSDSDTAFTEFIDRLNRKPFTSEAAEKGKAFNDVVDRFLKAGQPAPDELICEGEFAFDPDLVNHFVEKLYGAWPQYFCKGLLQTSRGLVELYGYIDEIKADTTIDIKTTGNYAFPKFLNNFQQIVYPFCLRQEGIDICNFKYLITDFRNIYEEDYLYTGGNDLNRMTNQVEALIDFIEQHRSLITDKKLFGGENAFIADFDNECKAMIVDNA